MAAVAPEAAPLWYDKPAKRWLQALPLGTAAPGAMVFVDPARERLHLTESTLWLGAPSTRRGGIAEMLLQLQGPELHLMPSAWPRGSVRGLRACGGITVSLYWREGRLAFALLRTDGDRSDSAI